MIALSKTNGGVRPVVVGYVLRRLAANYANSHVIRARSKVFQPREVAVELQGSGGSN